MRKELYLGFHTNLQGSTHQRWCELGHIPNACRSFWITTSHLRHTLEQKQRKTLYGEQERWIGNACERCPTAAELLSLWSDQLSLPENMGAYQKQTAASRPGCPELKPREVCTPQWQGGATCLQPPKRAQLHAEPRGLPTSKALSTAMAGTHHPTAALPSALAARSSACCSDFWAWAVSHSPAQHLSRETDTAGPPGPALPAGLPPLLPSTQPVLLSPQGRLHAPIPTAASFLSGASRGTALPAALILLQAQPPITAPSSPAARQNTRDAKRPFREQEDTPQPGWPGACAISQLSTLQSQQVQQSCCHTSTAAPLAP